MRRVKANKLRLHGLLAQWDELMVLLEGGCRVRQWPGLKSAERAHRGLQRRLREAH